MKATMRRKGRRSPTTQEIKTMDKVFAIQAYDELSTDGKAFNLEMD